MRRLCLVRLLEQLNAWPQSSQLYGFSPVWVRLCLVRSLDWLNAWPQSSQLYGFSPVWVRLCLVRWPNWLNAWPQSLHLYGFSPVWVRLCLIRWLEQSNCLLQTSHWCLCFLTWSPSPPDITCCASDTWLGCVLWRCPRSRNTSSASTEDEAELEAAWTEDEVEVEAAWSDRQGSRPSTQCVILPRL